MVFASYINILLLLFIISGRLIESTSVNYGLKLSPEEIANSYYYILDDSIRSVTLLVFPPSTSTVLKTKKTKFLRLGRLNVQNVIKQVLDYKENEDNDYIIPIGLAEDGGATLMNMISPLLFGFSINEVVVIPKQYIPFEEHLYSLNDINEIIQLLNSLAKHIHDYHNKKLISLDNIKDCLFVDKNTGSLKQLIALHCIEYSNQQEAFINTHALDYFIKIVIKVFSYKVHDVDYQFTSKHMDNFQLIAGLSIEMPSIATLTNLVTQLEPTMGVVNTLFSNRPNSYFILYKLLMVSSGKDLSTAFGDFFDLKPLNNVTINNVDSRINRTTYVPSINYNDNLNTFSKVGILFEYLHSVIRSKYKDIAFQRIIKNDVVHLLAPLNENLLDQGDFFIPITSYNRHSNSSIVRENELSTLRAYYIDTKNRDFIKFEYVTNQPEDIFTLFTSYFQNVGYKGCLRKLRRILEVHNDLHSKGITIQPVEGIRTNSFDFVLFPDLISESDLKNSNDSTSFNYHQIFWKLKELYSGFKVDGKNTYFEKFNQLFDISDMELDFYESLKTDINKSINHEIWNTDLLWTPLKLKSEYQHFEFTQESVPISADLNVYSNILLSKEFCDLMKSAFGGKKCYITSNNMIAFESNIDDKEIINIDYLLDISKLLADNNLILRPIKYYENKFYASIIYKSQLNMNLISRKSLLTWNDSFKFNINDDNSLLMSNYYVIYSYLLNRFEQNENYYTSSIQLDLMKLMIENQNINHTNFPSLLKLFYIMFPTSTIDLNQEEKLYNIFTDLKKYFKNLSFNLAQINNDTNNINFINKLLSLNSVTDLISINTFIKEKSNSIPNYNDKSLISKKMLKSYLNSNLIVHDECSICQNELIENDKKSSNFIYIHKCRNSYHDDCLKEWRIRKNNCPLCKDSLNS